MMMMTMMMILFYFFTEKCALIGSKWNKVFSPSVRIRPDSVAAGFPQQKCQARRMGTMSNLDEVSTCHQILSDSHDQPIRTRRQDTPLF